MIGRILDLVWPRRCEVCGRPVDRAGRHVCADCLNRIPFVPAEGCCRVCGRAVAGLAGEYLCEDCGRRATRPAFDRAACAIRFEDRAREMLLDYKFNRHWQVGAEIEFEAGGVGIETEMEASENGEYETEMEKGGEIVLEPGKKTLGYLHELLMNDGPEFCYTIVFWSKDDSTRKYKIGVCIRGLPICKPYK